MGQGNQYQFQGATPAPSTSQTGHIGQSAGRGRAQGLQAESSGLHTKQGLCRVTYARGWMRMCVEFRDKILLRGENVRPRKIQIS